MAVGKRHIRTASDFIVISIDGLGEADFIPLPGDDEGNQIFMISVGPVNGDTAQVDVFITGEGLWGDDFDPALVKETQWGTGTITACGCEDMVMALRPNADYMALGFTNLLKYKMVRLITPAMPCVVDNPN